MENKIATNALYFNDSYDRLRLLEKEITFEQCMPIINKFCNERNFKIYYVRNWHKDGISWFDVGSHSEFFQWRPLVEIQ